MNRTQQPKKVSIKSIFCLYLVFIEFSVSPPVQAQIIPDSTLGTEASQLNQNQITKDAPGDKIDGGATRGINLFHSFSEFNIQDGQRVYFANPTGVENILTRVTGRNGSNIFGTLGVAGAANLFLINPNGIVFGQNASLDVQGSFVGTTANGVQFGNQQLFSATNPQIPSLLIVSVPVGLQYGQNPGEIQTQGASLKVLNGQTLTLAGGTVNIDGGQLFAPGGRVELAGVAALDEVGLTRQLQEWRLSLPEGLGRADVAIANDAIVDVSAGGGGSIAITARNLTITGVGTQAQAGISAGLGTMGAQAGNIDINTTEIVSLNASRVLNRIFPGGIGNTGDIRITTGSLFLTNGGLVIAGTFGQGDVGNITIKARDAVSFDGVSSNGFSSAAANQVSPSANGQGGNISITTGKFSLTNGGRVVTTTFGQGDAGNITIAARDAVSFDGVSSNGFPSGADSSVNPGSVGQGGNISITTGKLSLSNGAVVGAVTVGRGNAGNITITARDVVSIDGAGGTFSSVERGGIGKGGNINITTSVLYVTNGGEIVVGTRGQGNAGRITIEGDSVSFDGVDSNGFPSGAFSQVSRGGVGQGGDIRITTNKLSFTKGAQMSTSTFGQGDAGNITITAKDAISFDGVGSNGLVSGAFSVVESPAIGQGGKITVNSGLFSIINKGILSVSSEGQGNAGDLEVNARQLLLDNQGSIVAQTASGEGGNITLKAPELLVLRRGSFISTTAGTAQSGGNGGNITFDGKFIVAIPNENSDISANAFTGTGGNIQINSQGIFGIESPPKPTDKSDITASSELGISGTINLNQPDNSSIQNSFTELSPNVIDTNALIANSCIARGSKRQENSFTITGSGALRNSPGDVLISTYTTGDVRSVESTSRPWKKGDPIIEPQGLYRLPDGRSLLSRACN